MKIHLAAKERVTVPQESLGTRGCHSIWTDTKALTSLLNVIWSPCAPETETSNRKRLE